LKAPPLKLFTPTKTFSPAKFFQKPPKTTQTPKHMYSMDHTKQSIGNPALLLLFFSGLFFLFFWSSSYRNPFVAFQKDSICTLSNTVSFSSYSSIHSACRAQSNSNLPVKLTLSFLQTTIYAPQDDLEEALSKASMANKTVIIAIINKAYAAQDIKADTTMLDLFLESFWLGEDTRPLLDHLLLVAVDQTAYDRCLFRRLNCYRLETDGVDFGGEKIYMSDDFIKMMWRRTHFVLEVLNRGYNFIFTVRHRALSLLQFAKHRIFVYCR
jgi:hypothetical protein